MLTITTVPKHKKLPQNKFINLLIVYFSGFIKLDWVNLVDNIPFTKKPHHFVKKEKKKQKIVTCDT